MRNPLLPLNEPSWLNRFIARCRSMLKGLAAKPRLRESRQFWMVAGVLLCLSVAGCFSLVQLAKRGSSKKEEKIAMLSARPASSADRLQSVPTPAQAGDAAPKIKATAEPVANGGPALAAAAQAPPSQIPLKPLVLAPPALSDARVEREKEDGDISRKRESWFFDQRAYPNKHIPAGAYQKALEQREAMRSAQRAAFQSKSSTGAHPDVNVVNFPGDALWHLMGPQPIDNHVFGMNGGSPTASGRITAIAVDNTDATGNTVYIGGAAGGVWKTTNGGTTWTPLTDAQPSLAIGSITIDPNNHDTIYVGTGEENFNIDAFYGAGILKSTDGGTTWAQMGATTFAQALGPDTGGAYIGQIAVQPGNSSIVLAAVSYFANGTVGGIYRSIDGGNTWAEDTAPQGLGATSVFFESTSNAGTNATAWMAMGDPFPLGGGESANGIYKSMDSGQTWTLQAGGLPTTNVGRIILGYAPSTSGATTTIYAAIADVSTNSSDLLGIFKTANGGTSWTSITGPDGGAFGFCNHQCFYDMAIGVHPTIPNDVVIGGGAYNDNFTSLFESKDGGTSWTPSSNNAGPLAGNFANGSTSTHVHVDTHAIVFNASASLLYVGDDGGMWSTNTPTPAANTSPTWSDLNGTGGSGGLAITQFYPGPSSAVSDDNYGFGGTQDNDTELFQNSLLWQNEFICGDGGFTAIDQQTPTTIWAGCNSTAGTKVKKAVFNGQFITGSFGTLPGFDVAETAITNSGDAMLFIPPLALDDTTPDNLYFGTCRVWWANNAASSLANTFVPLTPNWAAVSGDLSNPTNANTPIAQCSSANGTVGSLTALDVAHSNGGVVVAATSNAKIWETQEAGVALPPSTLPFWMEIDTATLPTRTVTAVRTQRNDSSGAIVYATYSGFGACTGCGTPGHVFKTTNATSGAPTWTDISGDLPDIPVNDIIVDHDTNPAHDALYIATDVGVFACPNPTAATPCANWTVIGDGLPNSPVLGLTLRRNSRILRAATHGRSTWDIQLTDVSPPNLVFLSSMTPAYAAAGAASAAITLNGGNFSNNTQVQFEGTTTGVTTSFVSTTQLNVTFSSTLLKNGGVFPITLLDSQGVDPGSALGTGGLPFTVENPSLDPLSMTPATSEAYTAVHLHFTATAAEPFLPNSVIAFYNVPPVTNPPTAPTLQFQLPMILDQPTVSSGGTVYDLTTAITDLTTPGNYWVIPYNPAPGGAIDPLALTVNGASPGVPFLFTLTANPGPVIQVSSPLTLVVSAIGANTGTTYDAFQVTNLVGATLNIIAVAIGGANAPNFQFIAPATGLTSCNFETGSGFPALTAGSSCFFGLEYTAGTPPGNSQSNATLNITDNATGSPQSFPITGLIATNAGLLILTPVNFGAVARGATSPTMNATLENGSSSPVNVTLPAFSVSGTNAADFQLVPFVSNGDGLSACPAVPFVLPPVGTAGFACDISLVFTPSSAGSETAQLNVTASVAVTTSTPNLLGTGIEITSISPSIVATGGPAFTLVVNGGGFASSAVVNVNGSPRLTTFINSTQLQASIPASDIATAGSLAISVTSPSPGGTTSEPKTLIVAQATEANNDNINFAKTPNFGTTTLRTASGSFTGGTTGVTLNWSSAFPDTNYTAVCSAETTPGDFLLPIITLRTTTAITVVPTDGGTPSGNVACFAIPDSDTSDIRHGRTVYSGAPANVTVTWSMAFPDTTYVTACTVETQGATGGGFSSVISALATTSVTAINGGIAAGTMHCIGVPVTDRSAVRRSKTAISGTPTTVPVSFNTSFANTTAAGGNYAAVCSDVEPGVTGSDAALAISLGSRTDTGFTVINEIPSGTLHCLAVPLGDSAPVRFTEDTTQATAQLAASSGSPLTPADPTPSCAPGTAALQGRAKSVWWNWVAPANGTLIADSRFSNYTTVLSAWTLSTALPSTTETFTQVGCASGNLAAVAPFPAATLMSVNVTAGTTYYIMASDASTGGAGGTLSLNMDFASTAPLNDDNIAGAGGIGPTVISATSFSTTENTIAATANTNSHSDPTLPSGCATGAASNGQANSVWFEYTPSSSGTIVADTLTSRYETILNVTSGTPTGTQVACNQSATTGIAQSQVSFAATSATPYFFMVSAFLGDGGTTNFHLNFTATSGPIAALTPNPVAFGNQRVNTTSSSMTATLTNSGTATLTLAASSAVTITGTNSSDFAIAAGTTCANSTSVAAGGATCIINLTFKPGAAGARTATLSVADNASPSPQSITLSGTGTAPIATVTPNPLPFGNQRKGTTSAVMAVTVKNTGTDTLNLAAASAVVIGGANAADFANAAGSTCANSTALAPNASCIVNITFTPSTTAAEAATLTITDDSGAVAGTAQVVNMSGTGTFPQAAATPNPLPFGNVPKGTTSGSMTVTLTNSGTDTLHLAAASAVVIGGANGGDFAIAAGTTCANGVAVAAGGSTCIVNVTFTPSTTAAEAGTLTFTDDASPATQVVNLTGTGTAASVTLSPSPVNFANERINTTSAATTVTLTNSGNASVTLSTPTLSITGTNPGDFAVVAAGTTCTNGAVIAASPGPGNTCVIKVTFTPAATGARTAALNVADNANPSPQSVTLNGTGTLPTASVAPSTIPFGNQRKGTTSAGTDVTVSNTGTDTLNIATIALGGTNPSQFVLGAPSSGTACSLAAATPVAPGANCKFSVKFAPTATGAQAATVTITDDSGAVAGSQQTVTLSGTGTAPIATVTPNPLPFGNQRKGTTSAVMAVTVKNTGTDTLNLAAASAVVIGGANAADFANAAGSTCANSTALAPNASCIVNITFTPSTTAAEAATLTITDDSGAVAGTAQVVNMSGTGTFPVAGAAPNPLAFGSVSKGTTSGSLTVTLTNSGTDTLHLAAASAVVIGGANAGDFAIAAGTTCANGVAVAAGGGSCIVKVTFTPSTTSAEAGTLTFTDDASPTTQVVNLTGTGTSATVNLSPSPVNFSNQRINTTSAATTITLTNSGNASVTLSTPTLSIAGTNSGDFAVVAAGTTCTNGAVIAASPGPGNTCVIQVTFTPGATGARTATLSVADSANPSPQSVTLNGTGTVPTASVAPSNIPFGNQRKGTTSAGTDVTVSNTGTDTLNIASIALGGTNPSQFVLGAPNSGTACSLAATTTVAPAANCKFSVKFAPTATGAEAATVTITDDSGAVGGTQQAVTLSGTGTLPQASAAPNPLAFGNQRKGTTSAAMTVTLTNTGTDTLNLAAASAVAISGANAADFAIVAATTTCKNGTAVPPAPGPGNSCVVNITFTPSTTAAEAATLTFTDDSGGVAGSAQPVSLTGTGVLSQGSAAPSTLPFGNQPKGITSAPMTVTLTNSGTDTLNLAAANAVVISGANAADFATVAATTTCKNSTALTPAPGPGNTCVVNVTFTPSTTNAESATLTITDDSGGVAGSTQTVSLTGTGVIATVNLTPSPVNFGNQRTATTSAATTITLTNSGNAAVHLAATPPVTFSGANAGDFAVVAGTTTCTAGATIAASPGPGNTCVINLTFTPGATGARNATINVADDAPGSPQTDNLSGTGIFPAVSATPNPLAFGNQLVASTSAPMPITLKNVGTDTLNLAAANAVVIGGANAGDFAAAAGTTCTNGAAIAVNGTCVINIQFTPAASGARAGTVTITDDVTPAQIINLTGNGDTPASIAATAGTPQAATVNTAFAVALKATVKDAGGNVLPGVSVTFAAPGSGASGAFSGSATVTTDATGVATAPTFTANVIAGSYNVTATAVGVAQPANFALTNNPGPPASITPTSGTPQTVLIGTAFATLKVLVTDFGGNPAPNAPVTFAAPNSGASGTFANGMKSVTVNTDNTGTASATTFTANFSNGGPYQVNATVSGVNAPAVFSLTNTANAPTITTLAPVSATAGGAAFVLTVNGTNFATTSVVNFSGAAKTTAFVSGTQLTANITAADIAIAGTANVTVTTPAPGGGTSAPPVAFAINNPVPTTTTISPTSTTAGSAAFVLTVNGTNFVGTSVVNFNGAPQFTTFNPATPTQLTAAITAAEIATAAVVNVTVANPTPGGGTSTPALQFTINNVQPVLTTLSPTSKLAGSGAFTLTVNGNVGSFAKGAVVTFNGTAETTTFVSSSQLTANINAADIATAGNVNVIVTNPPPAVGPSAALTFVVNNPVPTISAATAAGQNHIAGGAAFTLTVAGTNFVTGTNEASVVNFNGKAETTTFVSGTQITAAIPASDAATAGTFNVSVTNPAPGGGPTPTTVQFTVDGYTLAGPGSAVTVKAGAEATIPITITPTANGFANAVVFSVANLPAHATFMPQTIPNVTAKTTVNLMINTTHGAAPPAAPVDQPVPPAVRFLIVTWICALLAGIYAVIMIRRRPQLRRYALLVPLVLLLISVGVLAGCASMSGTPTGTFQLTVTATSGTLSQSTPATLTVQ